MTIAFMLVACQQAGYDTARYEQIRRAIDSSTNHLLGVSLAKATKMLSLEGVPWDEGYTNYPLGQERIYHFRGFWLGLHLAVLPRGISPGKARTFSYVEPELRSNGVWWVEGFYPGLHIDRLNDRRQRMTNYWAEVYAAAKRRESSPVR